MLKGVEDGYIIVVAILFKCLPTRTILFWELFVIKTKPKEAGFIWAIVAFQWLVLLYTRPRLNEETIIRVDKRIANSIKTKPREISRLGQ